MTLNLDDLTVTTFATGSTESEEEYLSHHCAPSWDTLCKLTCVTCPAGCETGTAGAC